MLLIVAMVSVSYAICFLWFWLLCRDAIRASRQDPALPKPGSNLIPFERGLKLQLQKTQRAV